MSDLTGANPTDTKLTDANLDETIGLRTPPTSPNRSHPEKFRSWPGLLLRQVNPAIRKCHCALLAAAQWSDHPIPAGWIERSRPAQTPTVRQMSHRPFAVEQNTFGASQRLAGGLPPGRPSTRNSRQHHLASTDGTMHQLVASPSPKARRGDHLSRR